MTFVRLLHLSDLHYGIVGSGGEAQSAHYFVTHSHDSEAPNPDELFNVLSRDELFDDRLPDIAVVSGDIGWSGSRADYDSALPFLKSLKSWTNNRLIVIPGNHDVDLDATIPDNSRQENFISILDEIYGSDLGRLFPLWSRSRDDSRDRLVFIDRYDDLLIVAANSAASISLRNVPGDSAGITDAPIILNARMLNDLEAHLRDAYKDARLLRIFVVHHHLLPFAEGPWDKSVDPSAVRDRVDTTTIANSAKLQEWLARNGFALLLHGHKHKMHTREDRLWRPLGESRRITIIGCGSSGVSANHREHSEPLRYNVIDLQRLSDRRWSAELSVRAIDTGTDPFHARESMRLPLRVGEEDEARYAFAAEKMDDCHRAIRHHVKKGELVYGFVSVVENPTFVHPATTEINGQSQDEEVVKRCFRSLHPEADDSDSWNDVGTVTKRLSQASGRFTYQHGPRLFKGLIEGGIDATPISRAIRQLGERASRAYVGLYDPNVDVRGESQPLPGFLGLQFVNSRDGKLDLTATFRNLELSFWWVVNMYEMIRLLDWAVTRASSIGDRKYIPGRITFFSALASWEQNQEVTVLSKLDAYSHSELTDLVIGIYDGEVSSRDTLRELLTDKRKWLNGDNLDPKGLRRLAGSLSGWSSRRPSGALPLEVVHHISGALAATEAAIIRPSDRSSEVSRAKGCLDAAIRSLAGSSS